MIKEKRQKRILSILRSEGVVELDELARALPEVSRVTLRRDLADLAEAGALRRTHGGATLPDAKVLRYPQTARPGALASGLDDLDAVILPPISGRGAAALRRQIGRQGIPFLAESAPQSGGVYLGPDNAQAGRDLGRLAGGEAAGRPKATVLMICHTELPNTQARADGFEAGYRESFPGALTVLRANGQGNYRASLRVACDAFQTSRIDVVLGVNDHSALAGMDAAERAGREVAAYAVGGERAEFVARVAEGGPLRGVAAFFPEVVGARAVDVLAAALGGAGLPEDATTPHALIRADTLEDYFARSPDGWKLRADREASLIGRDAPPHAGRGGRIGFMPHYPAHDWYRTMIQAMQSRASRAGLELIISPPHQGIAAEISRLRRNLAAAAVPCIGPGGTIVLGEGEATRYLAEELRRRAFEVPERVAGLTVITNALDVLHRLEEAPGIKVMLTSGEYQKTDRCLVGPSLAALFERVRADWAFLSVAGVSPKFGISAVDERLALAGWRLASAARRVVALADHTLVGADANHRIAPIEDIDVVITDAGAPSADRQSLRAAGVEIIIAGEATGPTSQDRDAPEASARNA